MTEDHVRGDTPAALANASMTVLVTFRSRSGTVRSGRRSSGRSCEPSFSTVELFSPAFFAAVVIAADRRVRGATSQELPPLKSMPRLNPRNESDPSPSMMMMSEIVNQVRRRPTKSMVVSPLYRRPKRPGAFGVEVCVVVTHGGHSRVIPAAIDSAEVLSEPRRPSRMTSGRVKYQVMKTSISVDRPRKKAKPRTSPTAIR